MKSAITTRTFRRSDTRQIIHADRPIHGEDQYIDELHRMQLVRNVMAFAGAPENKEHRGQSMIVTALCDFPHGGKKYRRGDTPNLVRAEAHALAEQGKVSLTGLPAENPPRAGGRTSKSSASPPAQASQQTTSSESVDGDGLTPKQRKRIKKFSEEES